MSDLICSHFLLNKLIGKIIYFIKIAAPWVNVNQPHIPTHTLCIIFLSLGLHMFFGFTPEMFALNLS